MYINFFLFCQGAPFRRGEGPGAFAPLYPALEKVVCLAPKEAIGDINSNSLLATGVVSLTQAISMHL